MNSFFFASIRNFIGPFLLGLVSFAVLSTVFLNQLQFIFDIHEIKAAFIIFSYTYVILPVLFVVVWLCNSNQKLKIIFNQREIIIGATFLIIISISTGVLIYFPNCLPTDYLLIGAGICAIIIIGYSIYLVQSTRQSKNASFRNEFLISYGVASIVLFAFFCSNSERLCTIQNNMTGITEDLAIYDRIKEFNNVSRKSKSILSLIQLKVGIEENNLNQLRHKSSQVHISEPELKNLFAKAESNYSKISSKVSLDFKLDRFKQSDGNTKESIDSSKLTESEIHSLEIAINNIGSLDLSNINDKDRTQVYYSYKILDTRISNVAQLYNLLHKKDWSNLINALKYKGLLFFSLVLLILLALHFKVFIYNEEQRDAETIDYHSIVNSDSGYKLTERPKHIDIPELGILTSGISLIILLIIPALKPTRASEVSLEKPFISFGLAQFFHEENNDNRSYSPSHIYNIDTVISLHLTDSDTIILNKIRLINAKVQGLSTNIKHIDSNLYELYGDMTIDPQGNYYAKEKSKKARQYNKLKN